MSFEPAIQKKITYWTSSACFDDKTRQEIKTLVAENSIKELEDRFYRDLEFGTGGLRNIIGSGSNRMNIYNVRKASLALVQYLKKFYSGSNKAQNKIAVTFDSRNFSREFAQATSEVFAAYGFNVLITADLRPVPMLSFMVRHFKCDAGVCITASHNPPAYNGYKVYWKTGGQVVPPHDLGIIAEYESIQDYETIKTLSFDQGVKDKKISVITSELDVPFFEYVKGLSIRKGGRQGFKIVYTPLHGSGLLPVTTALKQIGFDDVLVVPEQRDPDGRFPTVKYPNPEEKEALSMALELAKKTQADLVLGTDPDADRIGIVVREGSEYKFFNGNQIGCLLTEFYLSSLVEAKKMPRQPYIVKTIVTTDLQNDIANNFDVDCYETLTGFKWICDLVDALEKTEPQKTFVCGGEESYGFLAGNAVRDKDAVSACAIAAEMVSYYKSQNMTLTQVLDEIFKRQGVYQESLETITLPGKDGFLQMKGMMSALRNNPPRYISNIAVKKVLDYETSKSFLVELDKFIASSPLTLPKSDVLQFILDDGTKISVRPSGTEPKIKFYVSTKDLTAVGASPQELLKIKSSCSEKLKHLTASFIEISTQMTREGNSQCSTQSLKGSATP